MPFADNVFGFDTVGLTEKRTLAPSPNLDWTADSAQAFPTDFEKWYNDRFGFRSTLIRWHNATKVGLGKSPSDRVLVGKNEWLYYAGEGVVEDYRVKPPFTEAELEECRLRLKRRRDWLAERGIHYLFVLVPNKHTVYPEHLPDGIERTRERTRTDQLVDYLAEHGEPPILDLRDVLLAARQDEKIYFETDSHWNLAGAYYGYQEIIRELRTWFPEVQQPQRSDFDTRTEVEVGDLANMIGLPDWYEETVPKLRPPGGWKATARPAREDETTIGLAPPIVTERLDDSLPNAVVFADSFAIALQPYLAENFRRAVFITQHHFDRGIVEQEKPTVVIHQMVERYLVYLASPPDHVLDR